MGVDLPDEHVVTRGEVFVLEPLVLDDDGLPLGNQHVDAPIEHRRHHGERAFEQQHVVEHPPAHKVQPDAPRVPLRDGSHAVERSRRNAAPQAAAHEARHGVVAPDGGEDREHDERHDEVVEQLQEQFRHLRRPVVKFAVIELRTVARASDAPSRSAAASGPRRSGRRARSPATACAAWARRRCRRSRKPGTRSRRDGPKARPRRAVRRLSGRKGGAGCRCSGPRASAARRRN